MVAFGRRGAGAVRLGVRRGFTLIELLVVIAVVALLIGILLPALAGAREAGRSAVCLSNVRQAAVACRQYADENKGIGPAIGQPYTAWPAWPLVVQRYSGREGEAPSELYSTRSVLVCPTIVGVYRQQPMERTYAMNATGHAGLPGDPDDFDDPDRPGHIRFDSVPFPSETPVLLDSDVPPPTTTNPAPPTRTVAMIDFRQPEHVPARLGQFHGRERLFNAATFDASARSHREVPERWRARLP